MCLISSFALTYQITSPMNSYALSERRTPGQTFHGQKTLVNNPSATVSAARPRVGTNHTHLENRQTTIRIFEYPLTGGHFMKSNCSAMNGWVYNVVLVHALTWLAACWPAHTVQPRRASDMSLYILGHHQSRAIASNVASRPGCPRELWYSINSSVRKSMGSIPT